ncbi:MAG: hypothetical protein LBV32_06365 [Tannerellaceae bacterium]|nr:hypothetical protein [Tannerellaceae bacterium]
MEFNIEIGFNQRFKDGGEASSSVGFNPRKSIIYASLQILSSTSHILLQNRIFCDALPDFEYTGESFLSPLIDLIAANICNRKYNRLDFIRIMAYKGVETRRGRGFRLHL